MIPLLLSVLVVFFILGFPMMLPMIVAPLAVLVVYFPQLDMFLASQQLVGGVQSFILLAVPMFIFAADIMCAGQTANRLLDFVQTFVGHLHGGMSITTAATCTIFGSISGSTQATVVAVGKPMRNRLLKNGYEDSAVMALIICSAIIALLIPPSVCMIMYCVVTGSSVGDLFIAGILPGLLIFSFFAVYNYFYAKRHKIPRSEKATWSEKMVATRKALLPLGFPVIIFAGIYSGVFSPTEAAAVAVLYAFILEYFIFKTIKLTDMKNIALSTAVVSAAVFILISAGTLFSWCISYAQIPQVITSVLLGPDPSQLKILLMVTIFFFVGCMFVDSMVVIFVLTPIFFPVAVAAGIHPIHMGIIVTLQSAIGSVSPPFGCNIFTACAIFEQPFAKVIKGLPAYIIMLVIISGIIILVPEISTAFVK